MKLTDLFAGEKSTVDTASKSQNYVAHNASYVNRQIHSLAPGQTISGELVSRNGNEVQIKLSDDLTIKARLEQNMNLEVGKSITFEVKNNGTSLVLNPLYTNVAMDANVLKALDMAMLPVNKDTIKMTDLMMKAGLSIDRNTLQQVFRESNQFSYAEMEDIVDLHKLGMKVNQGNLSQLVSYKNLTHQLVTGLDCCMEALPETIKNMVQSGDVSNAEKLCFELLQLIQEEEAAGEGISGEGIYGEEVSGPALLQTTDGQLFVLETSQAGRQIVHFPGDEKLLQFLMQPENSQFLQVLQQGEDNAVLREFLTEEQSKILHDLLQVQDGALFDVLGQEESGVLSGNLKQGETGALPENLKQGETGALPENLKQGETGALPGNLKQGEPGAFPENLKQGETGALPGNLKQGETGALFGNLKQGEAVKTVSALNQRENAAVSQHETTDKNLHPIFQEQNGKSESQILKSLMSIVSKNGNQLRAVPFADYFRNHLQKLWTLKPEEIAEPRQVERLYERIDRQLKSLNHVLEEAHQTNTAAYKASSGLTQNLDFLHQLNQAYAFIQLPLRLQQGKQAHGELFVYTNKRHLAAKNGEISALLHLDMESLGPIDVYVAMQSEKVNTKFYVQDETILDFLNEHMEALTKRLTSRGYTCSCEMQIREETEKQTGTIQKILQADGHVPIAQYAFDVRT